MDQAEQTNQLAEVLYLLKKLEGAQIPQGLRDKIDVMLKRLRRMARQGVSAGEYEAVAKYIDWCLKIPWNKNIQDNLDLNNAKQVMDARHYSHENVKSMILEFLSILKRKNEQGITDYSSPVLAFVGVQGAGKTTLAMAIAESLGRPFFRISLGAIGHASELRGSSSSDYSGQPGQIVRCLVNSQCMNPVILLDEFDKVSGEESLRKDFMAIMLEILDPQQNQTFRDWYIDYPIDLSKILFIATANRFTTLSRELLDRLEIVEFSDYPMEIKQKIAKDYLYPLALTYAGLSPEEFIVADDVWPDLVNAFGRDQGVRRLERNLQRVARTVIKDIMTGVTTKVVVDRSNVHQFIEHALPSIEAIRNIDYTIGPDQHIEEASAVPPVISPSGVAKAAAENNKVPLPPVASNLPVRSVPPAPGGAAVPAVSVPAIPIPPAPVPAPPSVASVPPSSVPPQVVTPSLAPVLPPSDAPAGSMAQQLAGI